MGSPITSWEGAAAIFTGADSAIGITFWLVLAVVLTIVPIVETAQHETKLYRKHKAM
jgi:hypothetical protein